MRTLLFLFCAGALLMSESAGADDKKKDEPKVLIHDGITYDEKVAVKQWDARGKQFLNPVAGLWACRTKTKEGVLSFAVRPGAGNASPKKGSLIIDASGNEYEVTSTTSGPIGITVTLARAGPGAAAPAPKAMPEPKKP